MIGTFYHLWCIVRYNEFVKVLGVDAILQSDGVQRSNTVIENREYDMNGYLTPFIYKVSQFIKKKITV